jgi:hypothetical protein
MKRAFVPPALATVLEQSSLLPFLGKYLTNDSISDMESHPAIHHDGQYFQSSQTDAVVVFGSRIYSLVPFVSCYWLCCASSQCSKL